MEASSGQLQPVEDVCPDVGQPPQLRFARPDLDGRVDLPVDGPRGRRGTVDVGGRDGAVPYLEILQGDEALGDALQVGRQVLPQTIDHDCPGQAGEDLRFAEPVQVRV